MDEKEFDLMVGKVSAEAKAAIKTELKDALAGVVTSDQLAEKLDAVGLKPDTIKNLTDAISAQGMELRKLLNGGSDAPVKSLGELLAEKKDELTSLAGKSTGAVRLAVPIKTIVTTASPASNTIGQRLPDIGQMPYAGTVFSGLFRHQPVEAGMNKTVRYLDQTTVTRNAAGRSETTGTGTGTFAESAIEWTEYSFSVPEIADSIPMSKESLRFLSFVESEVRRLLEVNLALKEDDYYWDGTGVAPISKGIYTYATAFDAATYAATTGVWLPENANMYDLTMIMQEQISNGYQSKYNADLLIVNPGNYNTMIGSKDKNGNYIQHPLKNGNGFNGLNIVQSSQVAKDTLVVCDSRYVTIYDAEDVVIEIGYVGNQFKEGAVTMRAYKSTGILVRNSDTGALLKSTGIAADIASISAVSN